MILGDDGQTAQTTLDDLFRANAQRRPEAIALIDPPDRERVCGGEPRRLTYAEADLIVSAIAGRLWRLGLQADTVIGVQLPNTVESILTLLGIMRAGMIAVPLPLLWRRQECAAALGMAGAKAIITTLRIGSEQHCDLAMYTAADLFPIRYVCCFGGDVPDGVVPLEDLFALDAPDPLPPNERIGNPAAHVALVTFDVTPDGLLPVARNHNALISAGLAVQREGTITSAKTLLSTIPIGSFSGFSLTLMPWLLSGGTLALHHPFDADSFAAQLKSESVSIVIVPGPLLTPLADSGALRRLDSVIASWRASERMADAPAYSGNIVIDVASFGEVGLIASKRHVNGKALPLPLGVEIARTAAGTLALRGPMAPRFAFPPGATANADARLEPDASGFIDTCYPCRIDGQTLIVTGPPAGVISVGGYRFLQRDIDALAESLNAFATLAALPDALAGQRLAGAAADPKGVYLKLRAMGANPLIAGAFRARPGAQAA